MDGGWLELESNHQLFKEIGIQLEMNALKTGTAREKINYITLQSAQNQ